MAVSVAVVVGMAGLGVAWYYAREAREARAVSHGAQAELARLRAATHEAGARDRRAADELGAKDRRIAQLQTDLVAAQRTAASRPSPTASPSAAGTRGAMNVGFERMANPDYARLSTQKLKAEITFRYGPLYRLLQLTPEQIATFEANRLAFEQATMDVWSTAVAKGVPIHDPAVVKLASEAGRELDKELFQMLGADGHRKFGQYRSAKSGLDLIGSLAGNLYYTDAPLSRDQGERLTRVAMDSVRSTPSPTNPNVRRYELDWASLAKNAEGVLAPGQAAVLNAMLEARQAQQEMSAWSAPKPAAPAGAAQRRNGG